MKLLATSLIGKYNSCFKSQSIDAQEMRLVRMIFFMDGTWIDWVKYVAFNANNADLGGC